MSNSKYKKVKKWFKRVSGLDRYHQRRDHQRAVRLHAVRSQYFPALRQLVGDKTSVITTNCFAGLIMQDLQLPYNSPTLGLYFMYPDYIEFLQHLEYYLKEAKLEFVAESRCPLANERRARVKEWYPIGLLGGKVEIQFLHYHTEEEAAEKWYRRAQRVNMDDLIVIGMEQNLCTVKDIEDFEKLPFQRKVMFSSHHLPQLQSNVFVKEFEGQGQVGDPYREGHIFYQYLIEKLGSNN